MENLFKDLEEADNDYKVSSERMFIVLIYINDIPLFHLNINIAIPMKMGENFKIIAITETRISSEGISHNLDTYLLLTSSLTAINCC